MTQTIERVDCIYDHDAPYVVITEVKCSVECRPLSQSVLFDLSNRSETLPVEVCALCLRKYGGVCSLGGHPLLFAQAVSA